jgi:GGDEF domain-containing protein
MGTIFVGGTTLIWYVALGPAVASAHNEFDLAVLVIFAYPVGDLLLVFGILSLLWRGAPRLSIVPLRIFATGLVAFIAADITYDHITINSTYLGGDPVDALWMLALAIMWIAAGCQLRARPTNELVSVRQFAALRDNRRLAVRYQELASIDGMTGLYNRRHFMEMAEGAFAHSQSLGQPLVALMIDVDHFKQINDVHGHAIGDRVLTDLARSCREQMRPDDIVGRYGGDEFIITGSNGKPVAFTVSVGIAATACHDDLAMYEAKRAGGARWHVFEKNRTGAGSGQLPSESEVRQPPA